MTTLSQVYQKQQKGATTNAWNLTGNAEDSKATRVPTTLTSKVEGEDIV